MNIYYTQTNVRCSNTSILISSTALGMLHYSLAQGLFGRLEEIKDVRIEGTNLVLTVSRTVLAQTAGVGGWPLILFTDN